MEADYTKIKHENEELHEMLDHRQTSTSTVMADAIKYKVILVFSRAAAISL
jgi:hypothetical protein